MNIVLINPYELGRQPFGLAEPAALLEQAGCKVSCCDLSIQQLEPSIDSNADVIAIYVAMHTATRIAIEALPEIRKIAPGARLCVYGLYAPMNAELFRSLGVQFIIGGEFENGLLEMVDQLRTGRTGKGNAAQIRLEKTAFVLPDRSKLPDLTQYTKLLMPDGAQKTVGFAESTRGCKYFCRHCPVVPVYEGRFFVIPADIVLGDIRAQVAAGAEHISFGDPDFFNGPGHALRIVRAMHREFPQLSFDATIKIEHIVKYPDEINELAANGCLFILSAVEAVDDDILLRLDKGHTRADLHLALELMHAAGIALAPTFVAFTPWTTLDNYRELLQHIADLHLIEAVAPVQWRRRSVHLIRSCLDIPGRTPIRVSMHCSNRCRSGLHRPRRPTCRAVISSRAFTSARGEMPVAVHPNWQWTALERRYHDCPRTGTVALNPRASNWRRSNWQSTAPDSAP
jgi:radical SAM superfamily enzyme YgiQ (UPF0313 family)